MRLLNTHTLELEEYFTETIAEKGIEYTILSHTWADGEELSFQDWIHLTDSPDTSKAVRLREKSGYKKITEFVKTVLNCGDCDYVWVDTIGINKDSSAELSEAINSMYTWYSYAKICFAYLADVQPGDQIDVQDSQFRLSRWFTRGWTLQELIAPLEVIFFDQSWSQCASRSLCSQLLSEITGIPFRDDGAGLHPDDYSIAQRLCWAASRQTTRIEDEAYCLLGLFGVNMPLLYGENSQAFERLQRAIISDSSDQSIFAWQSKESDPIIPSVFAPSPRNFKAAANITTPQQQQRWKQRSIDPNVVEDLFSIVQLIQPYAVTNHALKIALPLFNCAELSSCSWSDEACGECDLAMLGAVEEQEHFDGGKTPELRIIAIELVRNINPSIGNFFFRAGRARSVAYTKFSEALLQRPRIAQKLYLDTAKPRAIWICRPPTYPTAMASNIF